jgi:hypothetical protein
MASSSALVGNSLGPLDLAPFLSFFIELLATLFVLFFATLFFLPAFLGARDTATN